MPPVGAEGPEQAPLGKAVVPDPSAGGSWVVCFTNHSPRRVDLQGWWECCFFGAGAPLGAPGPAPWRESGRDPGPWTAKRGGGWETQTKAAESAFPEGRGMPPNGGKGRRARIRKGSSPVLGLVLEGGFWLPSWAVPLVWFRT